MGYSMKEIPQDKHLSKLLLTMKIILQQSFLMRKLTISLILEVNNHIFLMLKGKVLSTVYRCPVGVRPYRVKVPRRGKK